MLEHVEMVLSLKDWVIIIQILIPILLLSIVKEHCVGAQPTHIVNQLLSYEGILLAKHLKIKGKSEEEIKEAVQKHKEIVAARYIRRKELRKKRIEAKKTAETKTNE